jgi:hypothetical protein
MCCGANRWKAGNRNALKKFLHGPHPRGGGRAKDNKSKVEKSNFVKSQKSKIAIFGFAEKEGKAKNPRDRASLFFDATARTQERVFRLADFQCRPDRIIFALQ